MEEDWFERVRLQLTGMLFEAYNRNREIGYGRDKILVSLSGGSLVFSMTLLSALAPGKHWLGALLLAWVLFGVSIGFVIMGMRMAELAELTLVEQLNTRLREIESHRDTNVPPSLRLEGARN